MFEDSHGLFTKGQLLVNDVVRAKEARALMRAKAVNGLSIGFMVREDSYDRVANVKSAIDALEDLDPLERYLCQAGSFSRTQAKALLHRIKALSAQRQAEPDDAELRAALESLQKSLL